MHLSQIANVKIASFAFALSGSVAFVDFTCVHKPKHGNPLNEFFFGHKTLKSRHRSARLQRKQAN